MSADFIVRRGATFTLDSNTVIDPHYAALRLEDGATLVLKRRTVTLNVGECTIGNDVTIQGSGMSGLNGSDGTSDKAQAGYGDGGWPGNFGDAGMSGAAGNDIFIIAGVLHSIGSNFLVDLRGGDGANGGKGGDGGMGGNAVCPPIPQRAGDGGPGGNGGDGGNGAPGGLFSLTYSNYDGAGALPGATPDVFRVAGGGAGKGGAPGNGGRGGDGADCGLFGAMGGGGVGGPGHRGRNGHGGETRRPVIRGI